MSIGPEAGRRHGRVTEASRGCCCFFPRMPADPGGGARRRGSFHATQIKEKYGTLRFYWEGALAGGRREGRGSHRPGRGPQRRRLRNLRRAGPAARPGLVHHPLPAAGRGPAVDRGAAWRRYPDHRACRRRSPPDAAAALRPRQRQLRRRRSARDGTAR